MARAAALKVYRTPIGFHDAYVAASSQKAALKAWGSAHDLFGTGEAEVVIDETLTKEPLARPGEVIRRLRATAAEQIASLPDKVEEPEVKVEAPPPKAKPEPKPKPKPKPKPPKPDDAAVVAARRAFDAAVSAADATRRDLDARELALQRERKAFEQASAKEAATLQATLDRADSDYRRKLAAWEALP